MRAASWNLTFGTPPRNPDQPPATSRATPTTTKAKGMLISPIQYVSVPTKPNPTGALEVARAMQVTPAEVVFLGDSGVDMLTAVAAGMYPAGVLWGFREAEELLAAGAQVLLPDPAAVLDLFDHDSGRVAL